MVVTKVLCTFSHYSMYPGHGMKFVAKDGKVSLFITRKVKRLSRQKIKNSSLRWTQTWRKLNKKNVKESGREGKRRRKVQKFQKAIVGLSLDLIKKRKGESFKNEQRAVAKAAAAKVAGKAQGKPKAKAGVKPKEVQRGKATSAAKQPKAAPQKVKTAGGKR
eukprot:NODE_23707_length_654_cov_6.707780.p1 GENE.NODE_23707_length_654_cov_6.707780~~NODE_23707_length_654_cov_6.707780.p1  ORF type:complete len:162 (+),score=66.97 NODE_23707_length_654_cov_6.707780:121-606(+)